MYEIGLDPNIGTDYAPRSGSRNRRGKRGKGTGERVAVDARLAANVAVTSEGWQPGSLHRDSVRAALDAGSKEFFAYVCECLRNDELTSGHVRLLIEMDAWRASGDLAALLQAYIVSHPTEVSSICGHMLNAGLISLTENSSVDRNLQTLHVYKASVTVIGTNQQLVITGTGRSYKVARIVAYQDLLLQLCGADIESAAVDLTSSPWITFKRDGGGILPTATIEGAAHRDIGYQTTASFELNGRGAVDAGLAVNSATTSEGWQLESMDRDSFRAALSAGSNEFLAFVCECLRNCKLTPGNLRLLIEMDAWKASGEMAALLQAYIVSHPTEVSHVCGQLRNNGFMSLTECNSIERNLQTLHVYKASVTVIGTNQQLTITGAGPSFKVARNMAYQRLLLQICGAEVKSAATDFTSSPWHAFRQEVGGNSPSVKIVDHDAPRDIGYQAMASFKLNGQVWNVVGETSPWKAMARHSALEALYHTVTSEMNWAPGN